MRIKCLALFTALVLISINLAACASSASSVPTIKKLTVSFPDKNLEAMVRAAINKPEGDIISSDLQLLTSLTAREQNITDLNGLETCVNLVSLDLGQNSVKDIGPLASLKNLTALTVFNNQIESVSPLTSLTG